MDNYKSLSNVIDVLKNDRTALKLTRAFISIPDDYVFFRTFNKETSDDICFLFMDSYSNSILKVCIPGVDFKSPKRFNYWFGQFDSKMIEILYE